jgi:hypothetical protein
MPPKCYGFNVGQRFPDLRLAARLVTWWQNDRTRGAILLLFIGQAPALRHRIARRIVGVIEEHGWVRRLSPGTEVGGSARRDAWELLP